jgi:hypothetical protein
MLLGVVADEIIFFVVLDIFLKLLCLHVPHMLLKVERGISTLVILGWNSLLHDVTVGTCRAARVGWVAADDGDTLTTSGVNVVHWVDNSEPVDMVTYESAVALASSMSIVLDGGVPDCNL